MKYVLILLVALSFSCKEEVLKSHFCDNTKLLFDGSNLKIINIDLNNNYNIVKEQIQQQIIEDFCGFPEYNFLVNYKGEKIILTYKIYDEECNWNMIKPNSIEFIFNNNTFAIDYEFPKENNSSEFIYNRIKENLKIRKSSNFYLNFNLKSKVDVKLFNSIIENSIDGVIKFYKEKSLINYKKPFCDLNKKEFENITKDFQIVFNSKQHQDIPQPPKLNSSN